MPKKKPAQRSLEEAAAVEIAPDLRVLSVQVKNVLGIDDNKELLGIPLIGVVPESLTVLNASNAGVPVIADPKSAAGQEYQQIVKRFLGHAPAYKGPTKKKGLFKRLFKKEEVAA